jgi:hypothetical protein
VRADKRDTVHGRAEASAAVGDDVSIGLNIDARVLA